MGKFNKSGKKEVPAMNTSSMPDIVFAVLFFFIITTTLRSETLRNINQNKGYNGYNG